ncbi:hypothetical protein [Nonomuraea recticatena]
MKIDDRAVAVVLDGSIHGDGELECACAYGSLAVDAPYARR